MSRRTLTIVLALALLVPAAFGLRPVAQRLVRSTPESEPGAQSPVICQRQRIAGARYRVCTIAPAMLRRLRLVARDGQGRPVATIARADSIVRARGERLLFATNAGLYERTDSATGMLVADGGRTYSRLNRNAGPPNPCATANFYCPPNGVFFVAGARAAVLATSDFARRPAAAGRVEIASQSGPMLVRRGEVARPFDRSERHRKVRNGLGVRADGTVVFAIADDEVSFLRFAEAFLNELGCPDALFLDGSISQLYAGPGSRLPPPEREFAAMFIVSDTAPRRGR